jgi:hypothetical protein
MKKPIVGNYNWTPQQSAFRERFRKKQMLPGSMGGMKSGVSSPSSSSSYARGMA